MKELSQCQLRCNGRADNKDHKNAIPESVDEGLAGGMLESADGQRADLATWINKVVWRMTFGQPLLEDFVPKISTWTY